VPQRSDETLFAIGSDSAMERLVRRYEGPLYGFLLRWCGDRHLAEDLFQETFLRLVRSRRRFDLARRFRPYLYRVALNVLHDAHARPRPVALAGEPVAECQPGPVAAAARAEQRARVQAAVARLPEAERLVVELRMQEGLTFREIAIVADCKLPTAKSRMVHALRRLRPVLAPLASEDAS